MKTELKVTYRFLIEDIAKVAKEPGVSNTKSVRDTNKDIYFFLSRKKMLSIKLLKVSKHLCKI